MPARDAAASAASRPRPGQPGVAAAAADDDAAGLSAREQIEAGRTQFAAQCGFCHGRDAAGGESGPDLTRSALVAEDVRGDKHQPGHARPAGPTRACRPSRSPTPISPRSSPSSTIRSARRTPPAAAAAASTSTDLQTGNAGGGEALFRRPALRALPLGRPAISPASATRYQGLPLLQRMLYPGPAARGERSRARAADGDRDARRRADGDRHAGLSRRVHDRADRRRRLDAVVADAAGDDSPSTIRCRRTSSSWESTPMRTCTTFWRTCRRCGSRAPSRTAVQGASSRGARAAVRAAAAPCRRRASIRRRCCKPPADSWPTYHGDYSGQRHSTLTADHAGQRASADARLGVPDQLSRSRSRPRRSSSTA